MHRYLTTPIGRPRAPRVRRAVAPFALSAALVAAVAVTAAAPASAASASTAHPYRHGAVPMRGVDPSAVTGGGHAAAPAPAAANLTYGGGIDGIGVTTGHEKVYLVIYGSQWGSASTGSNGDTTMSGDSVGEVPDLQEFFKGLGTGSELWSGVLTQYCEGVAAGAQTCPASAAHVAYPTGGALSGVWVDTGSSSPSQANGHQLGTVAVAAAAHFGNTSAASNRDSQYVILSPSGTHPDGFNTSGGQFCAWHDYNGDGSLTGGAVSSPYGDIAFTNMPYVHDAGSSCGQGFVNSPGTIDGVTIVEGHEYAETVTDQNPAGGWTDSQGQENGDKCAWISSGQGASQNLSLSTGSFAVQSTWADDFGSGTGGCEVSHPIVGGGGSETVTVTNPGGQTSTVNVAASLQVKASDSAGNALTYSAAGLPAGLSIDSGTGLISRTPTAAGSSTVSVTATSSSGASGSTSFSWTVNPQSGETVSVSDPGAQSSAVGKAASLQIKASDSAGKALTYSAAGLPAGLSINATTGLISGTPTTAGTSTVVVTAKSATASGTASFGWTVTGQSGGCGGLAAWSATTSYVPGDQVSYNGHKYTSTWYSTGATPDAPQSWAVWQDNGAC